MKITFLLAAALLIATGCHRGRSASSPQRAIAKTGGPVVDAQVKQKNDPGHQTGDVAAGKIVFRFETFGNEGFWTDAMRLPKGMKEAQFTPIQALKAGLNVDVDALDPAMRAAMAKELSTDLSPRNAPMLNDPKTTVKLVNANAVIGVVAVDTNGDGKLDIEAGDKVGIACAICHTITDKSVYDMPKGGSIGRRIDGPANYNLNMGALLAMAANSRAYYPNLQLELGGKTIGRAPKGLTKNSTEAEVDAYLTNPTYYPIGTFDETTDGIGNPVANMPFFRTDLGAPWGTSGANNNLSDIANGSYTTNLDLTTLVTPEGRQMLKIKLGKAGEELADNYAAILKETGVKSYPYVRAAITGKAGEEATPVGRRVNDKKLADMNAYTDSLQAPKGAQVDLAAMSKGRDVFSRNCTSCHNLDQSKPVPPLLVDMKTIWPGYNPVVIAPRQPPLSPIQDSPGIFDDKMIVIDASDRGEKRGVALPLLLDLARKPFYLHDASVSILELLLDGSRGPMAPHPFYITERVDRGNLIEFLNGLDTQPMSHTVSAQKENSIQRDNARPRPGREGAEIVMPKQNNQLSGHEFAGHVYMQTNALKNEIVHFGRNADGLLQIVDSVSTQGSGSGVFKPVSGQESAPNAFEGAGSVILTDDHQFLFATNGGDNSVSSFRVGPNGHLDFLDVKPTGEKVSGRSGTAKSLAYAAGSHTLYVLHAFGPNHIRAYSVNDGKLSLRPGSNTVNNKTKTDRIPTQIVLSPDEKFLLIDVLFDFRPSANPDGSPKLVVANAPDPDGLVVFPVRPDGSLGPAQFEDAGGAGPFFIVFLKGHPDTFLNGTAVGDGVVMSHFDSNGAVGNSLLVPVNTSVGKPSELCWLAVTSDNGTILGTNFGYGTVSSYMLADGKLRVAKDPASAAIPGDGTFRAVNGRVSSGPSDSWLTGDDKFYYQIYGNASTLIAYQLGAGGNLTEIGRNAIPYNSPQGLAGFDSKRK